jgi:CubicO group peptidase (beta-lactamase class C family)
VVLRFVVGVLIGGIVVAGFFFTLDSPGDVLAAATPSSTTLVGATTAAATTTTTEVPWVVTGEARFESMVPLPKAMSVDGGVAMLEYDLTTLGQVLAGDGFEDSTWVPVQPERWVLVTSTGSFDAETFLGAESPLGGNEVGCGLRLPPGS